MKGTEKQIAWAENIVEVIRMIFEEAEKVQENHPMIEQVKAMHKTIINNMENMHAGDVIDDFKDIVKHEENTMGDYQFIVTRITTCEMTKGRVYRK